ncbi:MAG: glycosyltransferase family 2 protein [Planctomycetaceae bacterium]|jgi:glycosyltransferase involved in cell wall biosynthesis|nr:glycosyltransferase family 2 protein [Planctomycetaceae bacterium]
MPKVSVIIPVYNVEKYLHACLDSVVNQTLKDIEIICVDDGSPDRCPQILDEYAAKDNRITVIHQQNVGIAGARNAAYPYIKGEYTLFVDDDDTIEPNLCEKAVAVADAEQADTTYFFIDHGHYWWNKKYERLYHWGCEVQRLIGKLLTENDYLLLLEYPVIWAKLWRSSFLLDNDIRCPTGQYSEDTFMHWKALVHRPKMAMLPEIMYHNRRYPLSTNSEPSKKYSMGLPATYNLIKEMLLETGNYHGEWKGLFLYRKLWHLRATYSHLPAYRRAEFLNMVKEQFGQDEQEYLSQKNKLKRPIRIFYRAILGSHFAAIENSVYFALRKAEFIFRKFRDQWKRWFVES